MNASFFIRSTFFLRYIINATTPLSVVPTYRVSLLTCDGNNYSPTFFFSFLLDPFLPYNTAMNALSSSLPSVPELVLPTDLVFMSSSITTITKCSLMLVLYIFNINTVAQSLSGIGLHIDVWV